MRIRGLAWGCAIGILISMCPGRAVAQDAEEVVPIHKASPAVLEEGDSLGSDWILREDLPVLSDLAQTKLGACLYQNGAKARLAFRLGKDSSPEDADVDATLGFDPVYFCLQGMPVLVDPATGERKEVDYRFEAETVIFDPVKVGRPLQYLEFGLCSRKLGNRRDLTIEDKLKQARTIRWIRQETDSWSPLAEGQIIAQETLRPIVSHGGYDTDGTKTAVVWANAGELTGGFELLDARRNRQHPAKQPVVYRGRLRKAGSHVWGGNTYVADFSDFRQEGLYFLRLHVKETRQVLDSYVFPIRKGLYLDLSKRAAQWFRYQRCGTEVPGFHEACHMQDAVVKTDGTRVDVTGGWHDAGDYGKWVGPGSIGITALATLQDEFGGEIEETLDGRPALVDEAAWEADYLCKGYWDGAFHAGFTPDFEDVCTWLGAPEMEPPRVVSEKEMEENRYGRVMGPGLSLTGSSLAKAGRLLLPYDQALADRCLAVAKEVYALDSAVDLSAPEYEKKQNSYLWLVTGLLATAIELHWVTGDDTWLREAEKRARDILALQDPQGWFHLDQAKTSDAYWEGRFHLLALYEFLRHHPGTALAGEIKDAFRRWADYNLRHSDLSEFGQLGGKEEDGSLRNLYRSNYRNRRLGGFAWGLATAALLCDEPRYLDAAEHQIQWMIGFNPADISMMAGVGKGPGCFHHRYCFMDSCTDGVVPGGILNGILGGNGDVTYLGDNDTKNFVMAKVPVDYPIFDMDTWGWTYAYATNEYWARNSAWFVLGALQIEKALRKLRQQ